MKLAIGANVTFLLYLPTHHHREGRSWQCLLKTPLLTLLSHCALPRYINSVGDSTLKTSKGEYTPSVYVQKLHTTGTPFCTFAYLLSTKLVGYITRMKCTPPSTALQESEESKK
jgi:hypothetical protein